MTFEQDYTGVKESGFSPPLPEGKYLMRIVETKEGKKTQKGDPKIEVGMIVVNGQFAGRKLWPDHQVCFLDKDSAGAGFSKHWLHAIGQPYEGRVQVNPAAWRGKEVWCEVVIETYETKNNQEGHSNKIKDVYLDEPVQSSPQEERKAKVEGPEQEEVPF